MKIFRRLCYASVLLISLTACSSHDDSKHIRDASTEEAGLNLKALTALASKVNDPKALEDSLNRPGSINNVDLDSDGKADYLSVTEYGKDKNHGLSITDDLGDGKVQEVANIDFEQSGDQGNMYVNGNQYLYGPDATYHSGFGLGSFLLMAYLFSPHSYYMSPYHYGYYPAYYRPVPVIPYRVYRYNMGRRYGYVRTDHESRPSGFSSPNANRNIPSVTAHPRSSLGSPMHSQRQFSTRSSSGPVESRGFRGPSHTSLAPAHSFSPHSSGSSPGSSFHSSRSFGSHHSSFGRRH